MLIGEGGGGRHSYIRLGRRRARSACTGIPFDNPSIPSHVSGHPDAHSLDSATCSGLLQIVQAIVKAGDEEESAAALNMLAEVAECPASLIGKSLPDTATWCFRVATARELPLAVRHAAMQVRASLQQGRQHRVGRFAVERVAADMHRDHMHAQNGASCGMP